MTDRADLPAPTEGLVLTHFLTVRDVATSRDFYADIAAFYADATAKGARFLTEPLDRKAEVAGSAQRMLGASPDRSVTISASGRAAPM